MSTQEFTNIPDISDAPPFLRRTILDTDIPIEYRLNCTYLENITNKNMIIDSSYNILLQARNKHVRVNNKMGIGIDPSSAYNFHVIGNTCISGDIITSGNIVPLNSSSNLGSSSTRWNNVFVNDLSIATINGLPYVGGGNGSNIDLTRIINNIIPFTNNVYKLGDISNIWSNAYINDISVSNIDISVNLNPRIPNKGTIGLPNKPWGNAYINDISAINITPTINISGNVGTVNMRWREGYINSLITYFITPGDSMSSIGAPDNLWPKAVIKDISVSNIDISVNLNPLIPNKGTIGLSNRPWGNAYICDISATNISVSGNILPLDTSKSNLGSVSKRWSNIFAQDLSINRINGQTYDANTIVDLSINHNTLRIKVNDLSGVLTSNITRLNTIDSSLTNVYYTKLIIDNSFNNVYTKLRIDNSFTNVYTKLQADNSFVTKTVFELSLNSVSALRNSYRDFSVNAIEISSNIVPLYIGRSNLGSAFRRWNNVFANDLSVNRINGLPYVAGGGGGTAIDLTSISSDIIPSSNVNFKLGNANNRWSNAYINDISATNISISGNIILNVSGGNITNINKLTADASNNIISTTHRIYQNINSDISWSAVNGYYGLAKDAYPALNPYSSGEKALSTTNISSWTLRAIPVDLLSMQVSSICWSPNLGLFVAVVTDSSNSVYNLTVSKAMYSYDGINWVLGSMNATLRSGLWKSVCWSAERGLFVAVASGNVANPNSKIMTSQNGITWAEYSLPTLASDSEWASVCWSYELGLFVAVALYGTNKIITSSNGTSWTIRPISNVSSNEPILSCKSVCWSAQLGIFVVPEYDNSTGIIISKDGITWLKYNFINTLLNANTWSSICWSPQLGIFVAVASSGTYRIMTSQNGTHWNPVYNIVQTLFFVDWIPDLRLFVALGVDSFEIENVLTSVDGIKWKTSVVPSYGGWLGSCWSSELGIVVAIAGGQLEDYIGPSKVMTSSLKGRPPTSYNIFDSCFNRIDESGNWTFANINVRSNILPLDNSSSDLGSSLKRWRNIFVNDLSVSTINGQPYSGGGGGTVLTSVSGSIIPSINNQFKLGDVSRNWSNAYIQDISVSNAITVNGSRVATTQHIKNTIPFGVILAYYSTPAPAGWALCDGSNGTPDLRGRFILGGGLRTGIGGIITTDNTYVYHKFLDIGSHTFTPLVSGNVDLLIVGGGAAGGVGQNTFGGGKGGDVIIITGQSVSAGTNYSISVGEGGSRTYIGGPTFYAESPAQSSSFNLITASGGVTNYIGGIGQAGTESSILEQSYYWGGTGGRAVEYAGAGVGGLGGGGGGARTNSFAGAIGGVGLNNGGTGGENGGNGGANTGGGGGGGFFGPSGFGGSGIVVVRYLISSISVNGLTNRAINVSGGEENVTLNLTQIPNHSHDIYGFGTDGNVGGSNYFLRAGQDNTYVDTTTNTGGALNTPGYNNGTTVPHNNMPPFYVLVYIMKTNDYGF
jgi:hypothetical protein